MERKRTTMGEAAQIRYKSVLPPTEYYPPLSYAAPYRKEEEGSDIDIALS